MRQHPSTATGTCSVRRLWGHLSEDSYHRCSRGHLVCRLSMPETVAVLASATLANDSSKCGSTMNQRSIAASHTYTVELRFTGKRLDPADISSQLNLAPSSELDRATIEAGSRKRQPFWAYNGHGEVGFKPEWNSLEEGLGFLVSHLESRKGEIVLISRKFQGVWWCGHFQASFDGGPTLSAKLLTEIGSYGMALSIDNYFSED
jgi:hypothetical protein